MQHPLPLFFSSGKIPVPRCRNHAWMNHTLLSAHVFCLASRFYFPLPCLSQGVGMFLFALAAGKLLNLHVVCILYQMFNKFQQVQPCPNLIRRTDRWSEPITEVFLLTALQNLGANAVAVYADVQYTKQVRNVPGKLELGAVWTGLYLTSPHYLNFEWSLRMLERSIHEFHAQSSRCCPSSFVLCG